MIAAADIHRIFRAGLRGPLGDLGYRLLPNTRRPVFYRPDGDRHRLVEFGTDRRAYPDNQYSSVYDCGLLTRRDPFVDDGESLDTEHRSQDFFDDADWTEFLKLRRAIQADSWPIWRQVVEFGERILDPKSERLAAYYPIATERHAEQWVEFHAHHLPAILDRYCADYPVR